MSRFAGIALLVLASFMLFGFLRSSVSLGSPAAIAALLVTVALPAAGAIALLRGGGLGARRLSARREQLRRQTVEAEILKQAVSQGGRLTAVDVSTALALTPEQAKEALDELVRREVADLDVSDAGVLIYNFHDAKHLRSARETPGLFDG